ncbi:hypothetical protein Apa02nite_087180 [Actinoplanes palleronii]|uniref:Uncharacterized protein n=1 Tax=Actinoplanes palleronii TaxID=113570 RepID=A0ABQ4BQT0_9ACTN|nr:hypothetical protein Apa02nite_087180 [Actinoplanes palleronii]
MVSSADEHPASGPPTRANPSNTTPSRTGLLVTTGSPVVNVVSSAAKGTGSAQDRSAPGLEIKTPIWYDLSTAGNVAESSQLTRCVPMDRE